MSRVRRACLIAAAALIAAGFSWSSVGPSAAPVRTPLLGLRMLPSSATVLAGFDPVSLKQVSPALYVGEYHSAWSLSPDGTHLALGVHGGESRLGSNKRGGIGVYIVDLETTRLTAELDTVLAAEALAWLAPDRLVASLQRGGTVLLDPTSGRVLRRWRGFSFPDASARIPGGLVMLFPQLRWVTSGAPLARVPGPVRLAIVDGRGRLRSVTLRRLQLGVRRVLPRGGPFAAEELTYADEAGLAVDARRGKAYVLAAGAPVATVDLATMRVSYTTAAQPAQAASVGANVLARRRSALWLGGGKALVFGSDLLSPTAAERFPSMPAGATLVDTTTGRTRVLDPLATGAALAGGGVVVYGTDGGLRGYTVGGRRMFHLLRGKAIRAVRSDGERAYVRTATAVHVVDVRAGRILSRVVPPVDLVDIVSAR